MEGIIKFKATKINNTTISDIEYDSINPFRQICFDKKYIGIGADGIGYGNISIRSSINNEFIISASATGGIIKLTAEDFSRITSFSIGNNSLQCEGPKLASSESLSHAAIYTANKNIGAVVHIHNIIFWKKHKNKLPTTPADTEYGTQAMADSISEIINKAKTNSGIIIMGGHKEGILSYSNTLDECIKALDNL